MIALDYQPFSIVDDVEFTKLLHALEPRYVLPSRRYMTETVVPRICSSIKRKVEQQLVGVPHISFTSDLWSTTLSVSSLISLTAHWLTETFERKRAILHAESFDDTHTGNHIREKLTWMFDQWEIHKDRIHLILQDITVVIWSRL